MRKMKVFFYIPTLAMSGAENQCCQLAIELKVVYKYDVEIIITHSNRSNAYLVSAISAHSIPIHHCSWKQFKGLVNLYKLLKHENGQAVLFCYLTLPDFIGGVIGSMAGVSNR